MIVDDCLFATIIAGIGLSVVYLRAEYALHRGFKAAEHKKLIVQRELHAKRVRLEHNKMPTQPVPSIQTNPFPLVRVLARALRISLQGRNIQRFRRPEQQVTIHVLTKPSAFP